VNSSYIKNNYKTIVLWPVKCKGEQCVILNDSKSNKLKAGSNLFVPKSFLPAYNDIWNKINEKNR